jgi:hypothetical protein
MSRRSDKQLHKPLADSGMAPEQVITELVRDVSGGLLGSAGGRFFGWGHRRSCACGARG